MPPKGKRRGNTKGKAKSEEVSDNEDELPPPPPPRPFKEIEGLPMSIDEPSYSILNNALSLKDSAVLYSSLMRSRKSYTNGNIFDLYWAKGKTKFDNDVNARDRMNKFCDCSMVIGPHNYDVRFFILKDDEVEKKRQDEKEKKKEKRAAAKKMREEKQRLKELKNKAKQEALTGQPPNQLNGQPQQVNPIGGAQPPASNEGSSSQLQSISGAGDTEGDKSKIDDDEEVDDDDEDSDDNESDSNDERSREGSAQPASKENTQSPLEVDVNATNPIEQEQQPESDALGGGPKPNESGTSVSAVPSTQQSPIDVPQDRPLPPLQVQKPTDIEQPPKVDETSQPQSQLQSTPSSETPAPQPKPQQPSLQAQPESQTSQPESQASHTVQQSPPQPVTRPNQVPQVPQQPQSVPQPPPPSQNDIMQTPESQMMIANLNFIARMEPALNSLMKIVATGNAKPEQIREFQGYIQRAKSMGPTPYYRQTFPNAPMNQSPRSPMAPQAPAPKKVKPPKPPKKVKPPKEKQLTTFQEMYVDGADLVFEFSENPNIRYHLPKDSIIEKLENDEILISTLVIHNRDQIKRWKKRQEAKKLREKKDKDEKPEDGEDDKEKDDQKISVKEEEEGKKETQDPSKDENVPQARVRKTRKMLEKEAEEKEAEAKRVAEEEEKGRAEREEKEKLEKEQKAKEQKEKQEKEAKEAAEDQEPTPYFSAISFTLTNISKRYLPIFHNSFNKYEEVKEKMEKTLKEGIRVPKYFLWYSVDAYEDENLAEALREALYLIENPPKGKNRKRALEENPLLSNTTTKKIKKET